MTTLRLRIQSLPDVVRTVRFERFPVRIGRDPECEYRVDYTFVSRFHARIDLRDGRLVLRDEGSRLGTLAFTDRRPLPAHEWVDLATLDHEFVVGPLHFHAELVEDGPAAERRRPSADEFQRADAEGIDAPTVHYESAEVDPGALDADALRSALAEALQQHQEATAVLSTVLSQAASLPEDRVREIAASLLEREPRWDAHSPVHAFLEKGGLQPLPTRADAVALRTLQELSRYYVPYAPPLTSTAAVTAFVDRLDHALAVLVEGTAALRYAFLAETELAAPPDPQERDLAARLLDWTTDRTALDDLREQVAGMVGHHRRLVTEAIASVDGALAALRPSAIEVAVNAPWAPFRYKRLWKELARRYEETLRTRPSRLGRTLASVGGALGLLRVESCAELVGIGPARDGQLLATA